MTRRAKITFLVLAGTALLLCWKMPRLYGQGFGSFTHDQPFLAQDRTVDGDPLGQKLIAHWVFTNAQFGTLFGVSDRMTNWTDIVSGYNYRNSRGNADSFAYWATNAGTNGIGFSGIEAPARYTNAIPALGPNLAFAFIGASWGEKQAGIGDTVFQFAHTTALQNNGYIALSINATGPKFTLYTYPADPRVISPALTEFALIDLLIVVARTNASPQLQTNATVFAFYNGNLQTNYDIYTTATNNLPGNLGWTGLNGPTMWLRDQFLWTNVALADAQSLATALHSYRTNRYGP